MIYLEKYKNLEVNITYEKKNGIIQHFIGKLLSISPPNKDDARTIAIYFTKPHYHRHYFVDDLPYFRIYIDNTVETEKNFQCIMFHLKQVLIEDVINEIKSFLIPDIQNIYKIEDQNHDE